MKILTGNRGSGITTTLVLESAEYNRPIITTGSTEYLIDYAERMGIEIPEPISLNDKNLVDNIKNRSDIKDGVIIDSVGIVLKKLLHEAGINTDTIITAGMSFDFYEQFPEMREVLEQEKI